MRWITVAREKLPLLFKGDKVLWMAFLLLSIISVVEVYSAASTLSYRSGDYMAPLYKHAGFILLGALVMWVTHLFPTKFLKLVPVSVLPLSWVGLVLAIFLAEQVNSAGRWLWATELAKISTIATVALILSRTQEERLAHPNAMKYILLIMGITFVLIFPENFSSAAIVFCAVSGMMIVGRISWVQLSRFYLVLGLSGGLLLGTSLSVPEKTLRQLDEYALTQRVSTWARRIQDFAIGGDSEQQADVYGKQAQRIYADLAMQEGGILGKGPGNSTYRDLLPQAYSDFIYSIILEEMGYAGGLFVVLLFFIMVRRSFKIALRSSSRFSMFLVLGLSFLLATQTMVNMAVAVGAIPITGQPMPFVSRGGWSILSSCLILGIILGVSRANMKEKRNNDCKSEPLSVPLP